MLLRLYLIKDFISICNFSATIVRADQDIPEQDVNVTLTIVTILHVTMEVVVKMEKIPSRRLSLFMWNLHLKPAW